MAKRRRKPERLVVCIRNDGYAASLERRKLYRAIDDPDDAEQGQLRVIDESGEDYLYPAAWFMAVDLPKPIREAIIAAA